MRTLVEQLLENHFHEVNSKGEKFTKEESAKEWSEVQARDKDEKAGTTSTVFQKGNKKVTFTHQPSGATAFKHIRFTDGDRELSYSNNGDIPSPEFLDAFFGKNETKEAVKEEAPKETAKKK